MRYSYFPYLTQICNTALWSAYAFNNYQDGKMFFHSKLRGRLPIRAVFLTRVWSALWEIEAVATIDQTLASLPKF